MVHIVPHSVKSWAGILRGMKHFMIRWCVAVGVLACLGAMGQGPAQPAQASVNGFLKEVHDALFASFLPIDELPDDQRTTALLKAARDAIWQQAGSVPAAQQLLMPFADLRGFGETCGIADAMKGSGVISFAQLNALKRQQVLILLQNCDENFARWLAATVRNFYIVKGYGAVQEQLTGIKVDLYASPEYIKAHTPQLQP